MSADYNIREKLHGAYAVDDKLLEALVAEAKILTDSTVTVIFELEGDQTLESEDIADLISDSTLAVARIRGVQVRSSKYGEGRSSIVIRLQASSYGAPVEMSISGTKNRISKTINECRNRIIGVRAPYSFFYVIWNRNVRCAFSMVLTLALIYFLWRSGEFGKRGSADQVAMSEMTLSILFIAYLVLSLIDLFRGYFFPQLLFKFGKSHVTYTRRFKVLGFVFSAIFVAGLLGYVVSILSK